MSGIAGAVGTVEPPASPACLERMLAAQAHRGPGGHRAWTGRVRNVLAAIGQNHPAGADFGETGGLPAASPSGRFVLICDGTIHNAAGLRAELVSRGVRFRTRTPAEVVLEALAAWGHGALSRFNGEWALALLDLEDARLLLARDHFGSKPLYVHVAPGAVYFASEIKAILQGSGVRFPFHAGVVGCFLDQTLLDAQPETFFEGIQSVPPAHALSIELSNLPRSLPEAVRYWKFPEERAPFASQAEQIEAVRQGLLEAVRLRAGADGGWGVLLSGGVDSSSIAAAVRATRGSLDGVPVLSGVSATGGASDPWLEAMSAHLACTPRKIPLSVPTERALELLESVIGYNDEPVRSFVTVTEFRLKEAAKEIGATTLLSGLGADEVFCGNLIHIVLYVQSLVRSRRWLDASRVVAAILWKRTLRPRFRRRLQKRYFPGWLGTESFDVCGPALAQACLRYDLGLGSGSFFERHVADIERFSLPALLHFDDRTGAAFGVQTRLPYLDPQLVSLVAPMPGDWKLRDGTTKWMLRQAMAPLLPGDVAWRKVKQGTVDAYGEWLKQDMRVQIEKLLGSDLVTADLGILDREGLARRYAAFCAQGPDSGSISAQDVFNPIAIELWVRRFATHLRAT